MAFATVNGVTVHYRIAGTSGRPRLVFLNSLGSDMRIWEETVAPLGQRFEILLLDHRGHGLTETTPGSYSIAQLAADVTGLLDQLGWSRISLVGLSIGGLIAQRIAIDEPQRIASLVLMDTASRIGTAEGWNERIAIVEAGGMSAIGEAVVSRWVTDAFRATNPAAFSAWQRMLEATPVDGYCGACAALREADLTTEVGRISAPTLVLCGDSDIPVSPEMARDLASRIPGARFEPIADAGHLPCLEQPERLGRLIGDHVQSAPSNESTSRHDVGMAVRRRVLGDAHVDRAQVTATPFDAPFQRFITEGAWGSVWSGEHFSLRERSIVTIALLAALGHDDEVAMHVRATGNTGATEADISEALMHVAVYAGVPAANHAIKIAKQAFAAMREDETTP